MSINGHKTSVQEAITKNKENKIYVNLTTSLKIYIHSPHQKCPILTLLLGTRLLSKPKLLPIFVTNDNGQDTKRSSSLEELASSSSAPTSSSSSSEVSGEGEGEGAKPPM